MRGYISERLGVSTSRFNIMEVNCYGGCSCYGFEELGDVIMIYVKYHRGYGKVVKVNRGNKYYIR